MIRILSSFVLAVVSLSAFAGEPEEIIRPDPSFYSQIGAFAPEWCGAKLCYGAVPFQNVKQVRAILVKATGGVYMEDDFRGVELLKPVFGVIGPVNLNAKGLVETGRAAVTIDARGEVDSVRISTVSVGSISDVR